MLQMINRIHQQQIAPMVAIAIVSTCIFAGLLSRAYNLGAVPLAPYWDEVAMLADARMLLETGRDLHGHSWLQPIFISYGDFKLPVYIWATTVSAWFVGITPLAVRFPSFIAGILSIGNAAALAFLLVSLCKPNQISIAKYAALASGAVAAITPWGVMFSRTGFEAHLSQAIAGLSAIVLLYTLVSTNRSVYRVLGVISASLIACIAIYTYYSTRFVIPVVLLAIILLESALEHGEIKKRLWNLLLATFFCISTFSLALLPMIRSPLYPASNQYRLSTRSLLELEPFVLQSNQWRAYSGDTLVDRVFFHRRVLQARALLRAVSQHLSPHYLFFTGDSNLRHGTGRHGILLLATLPSLLIGILWLGKHAKPVLTILAAWWLLAIIPAAIPTEVPHALRSLNGFLPVVILIGYGYGVLYKEIAGMRKKWLAVTLLCIVGFSSILEYGGFVHYYFTVYPKQSAHTWQQGYTSVAAIIERSLHNERVEIASSEYRLLLWLFAFSDIPVDLIRQAIALDAPFPKKLDKIRVRELEPDMLFRAEKPVLIVGSREHMEWFMQVAGEKPHSIIQIDSADPSLGYTLVEYVQN